MGAGDERVQICVVYIRRAGVVPAAHTFALRFLACPYAVHRCKCFVLPSACGLACLLFPVPPQVESSYRQFARIPAFFLTFSPSFLPHGLRPPGRSRCYTNREHFRCMATTDTPSRT